MGRHFGQQLADIALIPALAGQGRDLIRVTGGTYSWRPAKGIYLQAGIIGQSWPTEQFSIKNGLGQGVIQKSETIFLCLRAIIRQ